MRKILLATLVFVTVFGTTGCATTKKNNVEVDKKDYELLALQEQKKLYLNLQEISYKALETQRVRQKVQNAASLKVMSADEIREANWQNSYIPVGMERTFTIDWKYAPEPLLRTLANYAKYTISFEGKAYPIEKNVVIYPERQNIKQIIDDVGRQTKDYIADIQILEDIKHIKVIYLGH